MNWVTKHLSASCKVGKLAGAAKARRASIRLTYALCLALCMMMLASGCKGSGKKLHEHTDLSGTVRFNGNPLQGGRVAFFAEEGDPGTSAKIDENGRYTIKAPVGEVKITVDNTMLKQGAKGPTRPAQKMGAGARPGGDDPTIITGTYVPIPEKYRDPKTSGLTYTVKKGEKEHDIELKDD